MRGLTGGCSEGYRRAGFEDITGVDNRPQKNYLFRFVQADALEYLMEHSREYDVIHASPPCQLYSIANFIHGKTGHPDLIAPVRQLLIETGKPYVIENVPRAPLHFPALVCGLALGLKVKRHRLFESNFFIFGTICPVGHRADYLIVFGNQIEQKGHQIGRTLKDGPIMRRKQLSVQAGRAAMGIDWMTRDELSQAIPPAYTYYIGLQLRNILANIKE